MFTEPQRPAFAETAPPRRRRVHLLVLFLVTVFVTGWWRLDVAYRPALRCGPMVQFPAPGTFAIVWRAERRTAGSGFARVNRAEGEARFAAQTSDAGYSIATIEPAAEVSHYEVFAPGFLGRAWPLSSEAVRVPPVPGTPFRFLAFGDSGNGSNTQRALAETMIAAEPALIIHTGDLVYPAGDAQDYARNFFEPYAELLVRIPFMPSLGNHDVATRKGQPLLDVFVLPENGPADVQPERNYWFDFGDARFVALDTNRAEAGGSISEAQMREVVAPWLRDVLTGSPRRWKFVFFHHPPFTNSTHPPAEQAFVRDIFVPVFDECGIDAVFCGHNHLYERTHPLKGGRIAPAGEGTVYIVTGAGGVSRYHELQPVPDFIAAYNDEVFSFTQVDVSGNRIEIRQIAEGGRALDELTIEKRPDAGESPAAEAPSASPGSPGP